MLDVAGDAAAGRGVDEVVSIKLLSSFDCLEILDLRSSNSEFNKKPSFSCRFIFEQLFTNFSTVSQTTSIKLSSSVRENRLCKI